MSQENPIDAAVDAIVRGHNKALQKAVARARAEARREALEEAAIIAEGWNTEAAGDEYMTCGNGHFWDAGTIYDQARHDAAAVIRAKIGEPKP